MNRTANCTRSEIAETVAGKTGVSLPECREVVNATLALLADTVVSGRRVELRNFGTFTPVVRAAKTGRNPKSPSTVYKIPERRWVRFVPAKKLVDLLNPSSVL